MIETILAEKGVFGLWTISNIAFIWFLLYNNREDKKEMSKVINNNTAVMSRLETKIDYIKN